MIYKKIVSSVIFSLFLVLLSTAQKKELEIYSGNGELFILYFNGIQQTAEPVTNVRVGDIVQEFVNVRIVFEDKSKGEIKKNFPLNPNTLTTGQIALNKKGQYKIKYMGEVPLANAPKPSSPIIVYSSTPASTTTSTTVTKTQTTSGNNSMSPDMNVAVNMGGSAMSMTVRGVDASASSSSVTTETSTTTTSTSSSNTDPVISTSDDCMNPMSSSNFSEAKTSIASKSFEDSKMILAKQVAESNCLTVDQVKEVMRLFNFEEDKLEYAKFAYAYTYDKGNYYKVNDEFTFEDSISELNAYIKK